MKACRFIVSNAKAQRKALKRQTCAAMNFGLMKEFPVTMPLLAFSKILYITIEPSLTLT